MEKIPFEEFAWAALAFHSASSFGHFVEPEPPFNLASQGAIVSETGLISIRLEREGIPESLNQSLIETLSKRSSQRLFGPGYLPQRQLSAILWAGYGLVTAPGDIERRTVPSAGGLFPLHLIVYVQAVEDLTSGIYIYDPIEHSLGLLSEIELPHSLQTWFRTQHVDYEHAAAVVFIVGEIDRICPKYGERGYRYLLLEAGHLAQNLCLASAATGIAHVPVGGLDDDLVNLQLCRTERWDKAIYCVVLGLP